MKKVNMPKGKYYVFPLNICVHYLMDVCCVYAHVHENLPITDSMCETQRTTSGS